MWPQIWIAYPAVELLFKDPLPIVLNEQIEVLQEIDALNKVYTGALSQLLKDRLRPTVVHRVGPFDIGLLRPDDQSCTVDRARAMGEQNE